MIPGFDCYVGYGVIDFAQVAAAGYKFVFVKMAEGNEPARNDTAFYRNVADAKAHGLYVGGYFFPYPLRSGPGLPAGRSAREQAKRAHEVCHGLGSKPGELPHVVDAEWPEIGDWGRWGVDAAFISQWLREYCEAATELWGRKPVIYTYPFWWKAIAASADVAWAADYDLWIANYTHSGEGLPTATEAPYIPKPWTDYAFHQFSAKGSAVRLPGVPACPVDRDVFRGSLDDLRRLANIDPDADTAREEKSPVDFGIVHQLYPLQDEPPDSAA